MGVKATSMRGSLSQIRIRFLLQLAIVLATANFYLHATKADTHASLVLRGGTILTMDPSQPTAEAIAVQADRIVGRKVDWQSNSSHRIRGANRHPRHDRKPWPFDWARGCLDVLGPDWSQGFFRNH